MTKQATSSKRRPWYFLSWPEWLLVVSIILGMWLFELSVTCYYSDGPSTALGLSWWGWWIQPLQPFFSIALVAASFTFAVKCGKLRKKDKY